MKRSDLIGKKFKATRVVKIRYLKFIFTPKSKVDNYTNHMLLCTGTDQWPSELAKSLEGEIEGKGFLHNNISYISRGCNIRTSSCSEK